MSCSCVITNGKNDGGGGSSGNAPVADFDISDDAPSVGDQLQFTDTSLNSPTSWSWTANGVQFASIPNPTFYCGDPGYITFELTATNAAGSDQHSEQVYVNSDQ